MARGIAFAGAQIQAATLAEIRGKLAALAGLT
jgi:hypothetical protein